MRERMAPNMSFNYLTKWEKWLMVAKTAPEALTGSLEWESTRTAMNLAKDSGWPGRLEVGPKCSTKMIG